MGAFRMEDLHGLLAGAQADYRATMDHLIPLMLKDVPSPEDHAFLLEEVCKIGAELRHALHPRPVGAGLPRRDRHLRAADADDLGRATRSSSRWRSASGSPERQKGAEMVMFEESGHCPMWEEPEKFNQVVGDWIAAL